VFTAPKGAPGAKAPTLSRKGVTLKRFSVLERDKGHYNTFLTLFALLEIGGIHDTLERQGRDKSRAFTQLPLKYGTPTSNVA
jgi:hypothetical protein